MKLLLRRKGYSALPSKFLLESFLSLRYTFNREDKYFSYTVISMQAFDLKQTLLIAVEAGELLLRGGADVARVEETVNRIVRAYDVPYVHAFVTPTGIIVSVDRDEGDPITLVRRIRNRSLDLGKVSQVNALSRTLVRDRLPHSEALSRLRAIARSPGTYKPWQVMLAGVISAAAATLLLGGSLADFVPALVTALAVQAMLWGMTRLELPGAFGDFAAGALATGLALLLTRLPGAHLAYVVAGGIIVLVPGMAFTAAVRDAIHGDLVSSAAQGLEAGLKAAGLASGVGAGLYLFLFSGGAAPLPASEVPPVLLLPVLWAFVTSVAVNISLQAPLRTLIWGGLNGALGWLVYIGAQQWGASGVFPVFLAALVVGLSSEWLARWQRESALVFQVPAIFPLVPGLRAYSGMMLLARGDLTGAAGRLTQTLFIAATIAGGVALPVALFRHWRIRNSPP